MQTLIRRLDSDAKGRSRWFIVETTIRFFFRTLIKKRKARWRRFCCASVNFGKPISAKHFSEQENIDFSALTPRDRSTEIKKLADTLKALGAPIKLSVGAYEHVLSTALDMLIARAFVEEENDLYRVTDDSTIVLKYYANSIDGCIKNN